MEPLVQLPNEADAGQECPAGPPLDESPQISRRELDQFVSAVTHDLREPLRSIATYAGFLAEDYGAGLDEEGREMLTALPHLTRQAEAMIEGLRTYVRIGQMPLELVETDLGALVEGVVRTLRPLLDSLRAEVTIERSLPTVVCDLALGEELLSQLIRNAATFDDRTGDGQGPKRIEIGASTDRDPPVFHVRDQGIGIAERHRTEIFTIFKRLHPRDRYGGGPGVGLTLAQRIVERHGGRLWVDSPPHEEVSGEGAPGKGAPGKGATFFFTLSGPPPQ